MSRSKKGLFILAVLGLVYVAWFFIVATEQPYYHSGISFTLNARGFLIKKVIAGSGAARSGLEPGMVVTKFNAVNAPALNAISENSLSSFLADSSGLFSLGADVALETDKGKDYRFSIARLAWVDRLKLFNPEVLSNTIIAALFILAGIWLLAVGREDPAIKWFLGFTVATAVALSASYFSSYWSDSLLRLRFAVLDFSAVAACVFLSGFVRRFPQKREVNISPLFYVSVALLTVKYLLVALGLVRFDGPGLYFIHVYLVFALGYTLILLLKQYKDTSAGGQRRLRWIFAGVGLSLLPYLLYSFSLVIKSSILSNGSSVFIIFAGFSILLFPLFVTIGVVRYNLFDIDQFLNRFITIFFLVVIATVAYSLIFLLFFENSLKVENYFILLLTALASPWMYLNLDKLVHRYLWKNRKDTAQILLEMEQELNGVFRKDEIYPIVSSSLVFAFEPTMIAFSRNNGREVEEEYRFGKEAAHSGAAGDAVLSFVLSGDPGNELTLRIGRKRDEDIYTKNDIHLLQGAAAQISKALENCDLYIKLQKSLANELLAQKTAILTLAKLTEYRDQETGRHLERIQEYARLIALRLKTIGMGPDYLTDEYIDDLCLSSILHDIGKVGVPDHVLLKPGKLLPEEFDLIKAHPLIGGKVLEEAEKMNPDRSFLAIGKLVAYHHHEKWDGSGYPYGLVGEDIPLSARIVAIADVYDALRSDRPYKSALSHQMSLEIIRQGKGNHFDPIMAEAFISIEQQIAAIPR